MWYVIQTETGKEEELIAGMHRMDRLKKKDSIGECFMIRAEWLKRLGGKWRLQVRPLFPGYVFAETDRPEELYLRLKEIPKFSRLLGSGSFEFTALEPDEEDFLKRICHEDENQQRRWLVRLSAVETVSGAIRRIEGPLKTFEKQIERINFHKRYAVVRVKMCHREQTVLFGLSGDQVQALRAAGAVTSGLGRAPTKSLKQPEIKEKRKERVRGGRYGKDKAYEKFRGYV